ncbi:hypothetical protein L6164_012768 [Bauhinia variegata]|uniref:Uncharacterized protein n=1 Tax=Bauhinia variegata TaxID=167791 RepID=A0ACB9PAK2_BAUVA|nr:hypothetical protein L6164_012768 [Bauhinia variegata]
MRLSLLFLLCFLFLASISVSASFGKARHVQQASHAQQQQDEEDQQNPYYFPSHLFQTYYTNELGYIRVLPRFDRYNSLLSELDNYRILDFQSIPETFFVPHHSNAHYLYIVLTGKAIFTVVTSGGRVSYSLGPADGLTVTAGSTVHVANIDSDEDLKVFQVARTADYSPKELQFFFPGGYQSPQSYYYGFSKLNLVSSFNASYEEIQTTLLGQKKNQGVIVKTTQEQISQLTQNATSGPFNLLNYLLPVSNENGKIWEVRPSELPQLRTAGVSSVGCAELKPGSIILPHANSENTVIYVVEGNGTFEMASPESIAGQVESLTAEITVGDVYVIPSFHPVALRASNNGYLRFVSVGIYDENSLMNFLAGANENLLKQFDNVAKELTFSGSAEQVDALLEKQTQSNIVSSLSHQQEREEKKD